jgi:GNAT superfamily N-acetyltransferase
MIDSLIQYKTYSTKEEIDCALDIIRLGRIYTPGCGLILRMTKKRWSEYQLEKVVIAYAFNENNEPYAVGCIVVDRKTALPSWSTFSIDQNMPNDYLRINVWVKPKFRRCGIGARLMTNAEVNTLPGVECYDTGAAARKLYGTLKYSRLT